MRRGRHHSLTLTLLKSVNVTVPLQIANQVLTLQLTPQQQEKLELHLSRMTLEQQQAFLQMQHHILAKLQLRADPNAPTQPAPLQVKGSATELPFSSF